jgi:hypothetical protein
MAMQTYLVIGSVARDKISPEGVSTRQFDSIAFAEQLFKAVTGRTANPEVYKEFRARLFTGPQRFFDFVGFCEDGKSLSKSAIASLRDGIEKSGKVILLGKDVADKIGRDEVPPKKRIEIPSPLDGTEDWEEGTLAIRLLVDPVVWEGIIRLAFELAA